MKVNVRQSSQPRKVRGRMKNAPHHMRGKLLSAPLSEELKERYGRRSFTIRKGDTVRIMRGEYKGVEGKVTRVFREEGRVAVEGVTREKVAGGTIPIKIHASKVMITSLDLDDKWRRDRIEGKR
jgi:large subunit ribosomal protein L24